MQGLCRSRSDALWRLYSSSATQQSGSPVFAPHPVIPVDHLNGGLESARRPELHIASFMHVLLPDGNQADHALTIKLDQSDEAAHELK